MAVYQVPLNLVALSSIRLYLAVSHGHALGVALAIVDLVHVYHVVAARMSTGLGDLLLGWEFVRLWLRGPDSSLATGRRTSFLAKPVALFLSDLKTQQLAFPRTSNSRKKEEEGSHRTSCDQGPAAMHLPSWSCCVYLIQAMESSSPSRWGK